MKIPRQYLVALLIFLTLAVYWPVQDQGFVWDDRIHIYENPYLSPVTLSNVLYFWQQPYQGLYVPLTYTVWAAIAGWDQVDGEAGFDPRPFHVVNLILHALNVALVFTILRMLVRDDWAAFSGALLFAVHPVQVEAIAWVSGMRDLLAGLLSLVALWQYLRYAIKVASPVQGGQPQEPETKRDLLNRKRGGLHYALATLAFLLALLAKPTAVVVPLIAWVLDRRVSGRSMRQGAMELAAWIAIAVPFIFLTRWAQPVEKIPFVTPIWARPLVASDAVTFYFYKLFVPLGLGPDYGRSPEWLLRQGWIYFTWVVPCGLTFMLWWYRERMPWLLTSAGIFIVGILPVSGLIPFSFQYVSTVSDRYLYLSMLGAALALASVLSRNQWRLSYGLSFFILTFFGITSTFQSRIWRDSEKLWRHALTVNEKSGTAHYNLALFLQRGGQVEEAIAHYGQAVEVDPRAADAHYNLGNILVDRGKLEEATEHYRQAIRTNPRYWDAHNNLAILLEREGRMDEAISHYRQALEINPVSIEAHNNLAMILAARGEWEEATMHFRKVVDLNPPSSRSQTYFYIATALVNHGKLEEAANYFEEALRIKPDFAQAHHLLGRVLAAQGHLDKAIQHFREAVRIQPEFAEAHESLGRALAQQGKRAEAIHHYQEALRIMKSHSSESRSSP